MRRYNDPKRKAAIIEFDEREGNALMIDDDLYVMMALDGEERAMVPASCPHRGGPLHIADLCDRAKGRALVCPWHGTAVPVRTLLRRSLAMVRRGSSIALALQLEESATVCVRRVTPRLNVAPAAPSIAPERGCRRLELFGPERQTT